MGKDVGVVLFREGGGVKKRGRRRKRSWFRTKGVES